MNLILSLHSPTFPPIRAATPPPTDRVIDFGKHKGRMLGTLPSPYLTWVSKNLRSGDTLHWANLADQVLRHPLYQDRLEWEQAERLLTGNHSAASRRVDSPAEELALLSETFGWDNDDRAGWSRVDFSLLGTSKTARIPRVGAAERAAGGEVAAVGERNGGVARGTRERRRERLRMKSRTGIAENRGAGFGNVEGEDARDEDRDRTVENRHRPHSPVRVSTPFPGRESLLKKVIKRKR